MTEFECRFCHEPVRQSFADLGVSPLSNSFISNDAHHRGEIFYPLHAFVCGNCKLVQIEQFESRENIFSDYVYLSSYSDSWLRHCEEYADLVIKRFGLDAKSQVIEIASNDGYLLQYFKQRGIPAIGIEPAANLATIANSRGISTEVAFFGKACATQLVERGIHADIMIANNVLAHVPDINDFVSGFKTMLKPHGFVTFEFPSLERLIAENQFDTIYHEHFSYLALGVVEKLLMRHGLRAFDVDVLNTHGGSLRVYAGHASGPHTEQPGIKAQRKVEFDARLDDVATYAAFSDRVVKAKLQVMEFFVSSSKNGKRVAAYGAPAKGNTLLNYCGIGRELVSFTVDRNPYKQGKLLPGSRIPILHPDEIFRAKPDYILILPWNLRDEITSQLASVRDWGGKFVVAIPGIEIF
jgi:2-polyprenyl-3-methyl-5-hydroxy-6-metoxy-1,4-benzoquinol methylase